MGYEDNSLRPNQPISRAEMVTILAKGLELPVTDEYTLNYTDANSIPNWALPYVKTATSNGLIHGHADGRFAPNDQAKRAEVASILFNVISE
ncbi:S-layer homology domain-containing protein [Effusibacillus consociatus]|uniref:S-layer homology domain-containing protein n=1 Tax=Effusibacillus consociatus TaxID=1117041 RepID=A0ABV9Q0B4_9BACL